MQNFFHAVNEKSLKEIKNFLSRHKQYFQNQSDISIFATIAAIYIFLFYN